MEEKFDKLKTKVLKYILYKKRTEKEVRQKFADEDENLLDDIIEHLKESDYINDREYIEKQVTEFEKLNNMSIKEVEYKLHTKGLMQSLIQEYIYNNKERLLAYEIESAQKIIAKKSASNELEEIKKQLYKKGYMKETIRFVIEEFK